MSAPARARQAAMYVLGRCRRHGAWTAQTLSAATEKFGLDRRDAALCARLCRTVLQNESICDYAIDCWSSVRSRRLEPAVRNALHLGLCQLLLMDRIPDSAAVGESVELVRRAGCARASGLVNAILRKAAAEGAFPEPPGAGTAKYISVRHSLPLVLCEQLTERYGYDFALGFAEASNKEAPLCLTVNRLRTDINSLVKELAADGVRSNLDARFPDSLFPENLGPIGDNAAFRAGKFYVQDAAAAFAVRAADPKSGMRVLDGCAAPGGKSFLSAILMGDKGEIISCDKQGKKLHLVDEGAKRLGLHIISTHPMDAGNPDPAFEGAFDLVFADVPCSGLGVLRRKPEIRSRKPEEISALPEEQLRLLRGLAGCVRPGGMLLYSTCTVTAEENESVIEAFLRNNEDFVPEAFSLPDGNVVSNGMHRLWPHVEGTDGFFMCRMRKREV
ncbi:MAG: 16S rRNA (cytosine(967)-C(5))-methyltransferase RsmB [Eubacteriales bacterium]|nr:16S rRNA (cytosine(967)-C(5))-methyltransferase RsmB [Eubacteriales bacterium]